MVFCFSFQWRIAGVSMPVILGNTASHMYSQTMDNTINCTVPVNNDNIRSTTTIIRGKSQTDPFKPQGSWTDSQVKIWRIILLTINRVLAPIAVNGRKASAIAIGELCPIPMYRVSWEKAFFKPFSEQFNHKPRLYFESAWRIYSDGHSHRSRRFYGDRIS